MTDSKPHHRDRRCEHGFYRRLCAVWDCPYWDGIRDADQARRARREEACGGKKREPHQEER